MNKIEELYRIILEYKHKNFLNYITYSDFEAFYNEFTY